MNLDHCSGCPLDGVSSPCEPVGAVDAPYMIVTDTPSKFVAKSGHVLSSGALTVLGRGLTEEGFRKSELQFVPQIRCPHEADTYTTAEKRDIQKHCREHLLDEIYEARPVAILPLGAEPSKQVFGRAVKISKAHGIVEYSEEHKAHVLPLLHPGQVAMYPQHAPAFASDCATLRRLVDNDFDQKAASSSLFGEYQIVEDLEFLIEQNPEIIFFDTENTSLEYFKKGKDNIRDYVMGSEDKAFDPPAAILTMQFCIKPGEAYMLIWDHPERPIPMRRKAKIKEQLTRLLCRPDVQVIGQNIKYDNNYLFEQTGIRFRIGGDTLMLCAILDENMISKGQDAAVKRYVPEMAGYADCVAPDTEILLADMRKVRADTLQVGDVLCAFTADTDGRKASRRKLARSTVTGVQRLRKLCVEIETLSGRRITVSNGHLMLSKLGEADKGGGWRWRKATDLAIGTCLKPFPWEDALTTYDAGYVSGVIDGEGWLQAGRTRVGIAQKPGEVLENTRRILAEAGVVLGHSTDKRKEVEVVNITMDGLECIKVLQMFRPRRLLASCKWEGAGLPTNGMRHDPIVRITNVGMQDVVGLRTSTQTIISNGLCSHNSFNSTTDKSRMWEVPIEKLIDYGCGDVDSGLRLYHVLHDLLLQDRRLTEHYQRVSLPGLNTFAAVEYLGIMIDDEALDAFQEVMETTVAEQYATLIAQVPKSIKRLHIDKGLKFSRGDFTRDILFNHKDGFRLKPKVFTKTTAKLAPDKRVPSTSSKDHLPYFYDDCPFTMQLSQYVKDERLLGTSVKGFRNKYIHDGLVRPTYSLWTTVTGRSSCVKDDTPIDTMRGVVRADAVVEGDYVFTHRGRWRRVVELFRKVPTMMYSLYLSNGEILTVTGEHRLLLNSGEWSTVHSLLEIGEGNALAMQSASEGSHTYSQSSKHLQNATTNDTGSSGPSWSQSLNGAGNDRALSIPGGVQSAQEYPIPQEQAGGEESAVRARMGVRLRGWTGVPNAISGGEKVLCTSDSIRGVPRDTRSPVTGGFGSAPYRREPEAQQDRKSSGLYGRGAPEDTRTVPNAGGGLTIEKVICAGVHRVYDFQVDEDHSYLACGVFNHNSENPNGQNFPKRGNNATAYRRIFVPPPGYYVLEADLSQAELRISADMAGDSTMLEIYRNKGDIHTATALIVMQVSMEEFRKLPKAEQKAARSKAKAVNFGFIYGMGWRKFIGYAKTQYGVEFTEREAQRIRTQFFETYYALPDWHEAMREFARRNKFVRSYSGRIRHLPMIDSDDEMVQAEAGRQAINSPVQGFGSDLGIMACGRLHEEIDSRYLAPIAFVHDAIYCYVPEKYLEWGAKTLKWYMESNNIAEWFGIKMKAPIVADVSFGKNFGDTYEMEGLSLDEPYDFGKLWDEEKQYGIKDIVEQFDPPRGGLRKSPPYTRPQ